MAPNDRNDYNAKGTTYMLYLCPRVPNFTLFNPMANRFQVTGHFETSALNDTKTALTTAGSYSLYSFICVLVVSPSPTFISIPLYAQPFSDLRSTLF